MMLRSGLCGDHTITSIGTVGAEGSRWTGVSYLVISWWTIRGWQASTSMPECFASSWLPKSRSKLRNL
ncbi:hypothetical protein ILYODFUR_031197 [Ilyodon furcidens]|uniref:Uncharacterized protein n=1 Tax=Ilyodon furcidens TaxID=33524 RepID=A0ABV0TR77_9TELE